MKEDTNYYISVTPREREKVGPYQWMNVVCGERELLKFETVEEAMKYMEAWKNNPTNYDIVYQVNSEDARSMFPHKFK